jgi:twitching motility two-component system response regulator PilG
MGSKRTVAVAMIGIPEYERHILLNIFKLSSYRPRSYALFNGASEKPAEILMVDADDPKAIAEWRALGVGGTGTTRTTFGGENRTKPAIPTIMVTKEKLVDSLPNYIRRPFVATRVLSVLDQVPIEEISSAQERIIGEQVKPPAPAQPPAPVKPPVSAPPVNKEQEQQSYRALVVDDSLPVRKQIELELKLFGIQVEAVETGEQAFALLDRKSFDLIFLDVVLPGIDGYQICKAIKKNKAMKRTPVIMLTGKSSPFDRVKGALSGCDTYLTKPVKQASFHKVVKKYLQQVSAIA